jgi:hypothetical protein
VTWFARSLALVVTLGCATLGCVPSNEPGARAESPCDPAPVPARFEEATAGRLADTRANGNILWVFRDRTMTAVLSCVDSVGLPTHEVAVVDAGRTLSAGGGEASGTNIGAVETLFFPPTRSPSVVIEIDGVPSAVVTFPSVSAEGSCPPRDFGDILLRGCGVLHHVQWVTPLRVPSQSVVEVTGLATSSSGRSLGFMLWNVRNDNKGHLVIDFSIRHAKRHVALSIASVVMRQGERIWTLTPNVDAHVRVNPWGPETRSRS